MTGSEAAEVGHLLDDLEFRWMGASSRDGHTIEFEEAAIEGVVPPGLASLAASLETHGFTVSNFKLRMGRAVGPDQTVFHLCGYVELSDGNAILVARPVKPSGVIDPGARLSMMMGQPGPEVDVELDADAASSVEILNRTRYVVDAMRPGDYPAFGPDVEDRARSIADGLRETYAGLPFDVPRIVVLAEAPALVARERLIFDGLPPRLAATPSS